MMILGAERNTQEEDAVRGMISLMILKHSHCRFYQIFW